MNALQIAIDGPTAAGKSTIAQLVAQRLEIDCFLTGKLYRALALYIYENKYDQTNEKEVLLAFEKIDLRYVFKHTNDHQIANRVYLGSRDVTDQLFDSHIGISASRIAMYPNVRKKMVRLQKEHIRGRNVVVEGRDSGIRIVPSSPLKIFLTASFETRIERRISQYRAKGLPQTQREVKRELQLRDRQDSTRTPDPLEQTEDSIVIDTTNTKPEQTVLYITQLLKEKKLV